MIMNRIKDWRLFKNVKRHEKAYVNRMKDEFEQSGMECPEIRIRGHLIDNQKLKRYRKGLGEPGSVAFKAEPPAEGLCRFVDIRVGSDPVKRRRLIQPVLAEGSTSSLSEITPGQNLNPEVVLPRSVATPWSLRIQEIVFQSIDRCSDAMVRRGSPGHWNMPDKFYTGTTMLRNNKNTVAWNMIREGFAMVKDMISGRYRLLLHCLFNLLCYNRFEGFDELRVALLRHFWEMSSTILGRRHPTTIICHLMATSPNFVAKEIAESAWRVQISVFREKLGAIDVDTLNSELELARNYVNASRYDEAEALLQDLLGKSRGQLGDRHPFTKSIVSALSWCFQRQRHYSKSEAVIRCILQRGPGDESGTVALTNIWDEARLDDHESPEQELTLRVELAYLREVQGNYQESEIFFWKILECCLRRPNLFNDHLTVETLENLERVMIKRGNADGVEALRTDFPAVLG